VTTKIANRLFDLSAHVESIVHLGYMATDGTSDALREFIEDFDSQTLGQLLELDVEKQEWLSKLLGRGDLSEIATELGRGGFLIKIEGRIFRQVAAGHYTSTCASAAEYAYAPTAVDIDSAISAALDRLEPRLRRPAAE